MRFDRIVPALANAYLFGQGIATDLPTGQMAFLKSRPDVELPDVQLIFHAAPLTATPYFAPFRRPYVDSYGCRAVVLRPESRGRVELVSSDPRRPSRIQQNFLATDNDWKTLRSGLRMARDVCRQAPMRPFMEREFAPGERAVTDADLDEHIRANSITVHHPLGTCKMGLATDPMAVVDSELRVFGTEGLRVVDGSVMPNLVGGNINAPIIMIAEKAADLILGRHAARRPSPVPAPPAGPKRFLIRVPAGPSFRNPAAHKPRSGLHNPVTPAYKLVAGAAVRHESGGKS